MIKKIEALIVGAEEAIAAFDEKARTAATKEYQATYLGFKQGLTHELDVLRELLEDAKMQKEFE